MTCEQRLKEAHHELRNLKKRFEILQNEQQRMDRVYELFNTYTITSETDIHGRITYVSEPFLEISGYSKEELLGKNHNIIRHEDMPKETFEEIWKTIKSKNIWRGEVKNRKKDGGFYWVDSIVFPILNSKQEIQGYKSIRIDITDKKRLEEMLSEVLKTDELISV
jgi:PAS domain S-box-containing protein